MILTSPVTPSPTSTTIRYVKSLPACFTVTKSNISDEGTCSVTITVNLLVFWYPSVQQRGLKMADWWRLTSPFLCVDLELYFCSQLQYEHFSFEVKHYDGAHKPMTPRLIYLTELNQGYANAKMLEDRWHSYDLTPVHSMTVFQIGTRVNKAL